MRQDAFATGAQFRVPLGELTALPRHLAVFGKENYGRENEMG